MNYQFQQIEYSNDKILKKEPQKVLGTKNNIAIIVHVFYVDVWTEIIDYLKQLDIAYDLYVTVSQRTSDSEIIDIISSYPTMSVYMVENRGRDVLPFLQILNIIDTSAYQSICKIHTKKSVEIDNGDAWRKLLYFDLIGSQETVTDIVNAFNTNPHLGLVTGKNLILNAIKFDLGNMENVKALSDMAHLTFTHDFNFAAGTMFWIRPDILDPIISLFQEGKLVFEDEDKQTDNTLAHAIERFFGFSCKVKNYELIQSRSDYSKLDKETIEMLTVLAFTQRFSYDMKVQYRDTLIQNRDSIIQDRDQEIQSIQNSKSYKLTKPFRKLPFIINTLMHFNLKKVNIHGTDEHKLALAIKNRIPEKLFLLIKKILKRKAKLGKKEKLWDKPLTTISQNKGQRVLIVAELSIPQCKKYRVDQKVEMLSSLGYDSLVVSWTDYYEARSLLQLCGMVIFYRVPAHDVVKSLIKESNRLGLITFFDVDDLVFEKELLRQNINIQNLPKKVQKELLSGADSYQEALSLSHHSMASTNVLGDYMKQHCDGQNYIIPNCLDNELLKYIDTQYDEKNHQSSDMIKIVYGSGTSTHDIDFMEVADALLFLLKKYKNLQFVLHGTLTLPNSFSDLESQVIKIPFMKANEYYAALQTYDINIAPLEKSIFNDAKSNIKYLEASIFKIPTVASNITEYNAIIEHGINGFLAANTASWTESLEALILDRSLRKKVSEEAYRKVLDEYRIASIAKKYFLPILEEYLPKKNEDVKKILMANVLYNPISFGGATIVIEELSKLINRKDAYEVTIFTGFFDTDYDLHRDYDLIRYEVNGIPVILMRFPEPMLPKMEYHNDLMEDVFNQVLKTVQPDLVHFHSIQQLSASIAKPCIHNKIPYIITLHDMWWLCEKQFMIMPNNKYCHQKKIDTDFCIANCTHNENITNERTNYLKPILNDAHLLLTPSSFQREMYLHNNIASEKIKVNKNGIEFPSKDFTKTTSDKVRFAYLGGNAVHKGYDFIKEIFTSVTDSNYALTLVDLHIKLGHHSIFEADWDIKGDLILSEGYAYGQKGLDDFFSSIDVLLFPSQWKESFGLTIREALVRDVWVISTDAGGVIEDIMENENGNIIDMEDLKSYKEKIESCIAKPKFFNDYINPYKNKIRSYTEQADELLEYYDNLISSDVKAK